MIKPTIISLQAGEPPVQFGVDYENPKTEFNDNELIRMQPYGLSIGPEMIRPVLILKAEDSELTLPVPINPLEAGVTLGQSNKSIAPVTPHKATQVLLSELGVKIEKCVFVEIRGQYQYVRLFLSGEAKVRSVKVRADDAMSLVLHLEVPIYTTLELAQKSKIITAETAKMTKEALAFIKSGRNHPYIN